MSLRFLSLLVVLLIATGCTYSHWSENDIPLSDARERKTLVLEGAFLDDAPACLDTGLTVQFWRPGTVNGPPSSTPTYVWHTIPSAFVSTEIEATPLIEYFVGTTPYDVYRWKAEFQMQQEHFRMYGMRTQLGDKAIYRVKCGEDVLFAFEKPTIREAGVDYLTPVRCLLSKLWDVVHESVSSSGLAQLYGGETDLADCGWQTLEDTLTFTTY